MLQDPHSRVYVNNLEAFAAWIWFLVATEDPNILLGRILTVPFRWDQDLQNLPDRGWDEAIELGVETQLLGTDPNTMCALEITLDSQARGRHLSSVCFAHLHRIAMERQLTNFVAPVRPTSKADNRDESMPDFLRRAGPDGLSADPWLRTHQSVGGRIIKVAPMSMTITGTFNDWFKWTGMELERFGTAADVAGGLVPLLIDHSNEIAAYIEPNVWVAHEVAVLAE